MATVLLEEKWTDQVAAHFQAKIIHGVVTWVRKGVRYSLHQANGNILRYKGTTLGSVVLYRLEWSSLVDIRLAENHKVELVFEYEGLTTPVTISKDAPPVIGETKPTESSHEEIVS